MNGVIYGEVGGGAGLLFLVDVSGLQESKAAIAVGEAAILPPSFQKGLRGDASKMTVLPTGKGGRRRVLSQTTSGRGGGGGGGGGRPCWPSWQAAGADAELADGAVQRPGADIPGGGSH